MLRTVGNGFNLLQRNGIPFLLGYPLVSARFSSDRSTESKICLACKGQFSKEDLTTLQERTDCRTLSGIMEDLSEKRLEGIFCNYVRTPTYYEGGDTQNSCLIAERVDSLVSHKIGKLSDVFIHPKSAQDITLWMGATIRSPKADHGNMSGDYGKGILKFLREECMSCFQSPIEGLVDIGGQNNLTVKRVQAFLKENNPSSMRNIQSVVIDVNPVCPFLAPKEPNITYIIGNVLKFSTCDKSYFERMGKNRIFILNNLLNILQPGQGWEMLHSAWDIMNEGDYMMIGGLPVEQLKSFSKGAEEHGIIAFHRKDNSNAFHKSGLSTLPFIERIKDEENGLKGAKVLMNGRKSLPIEVQSKLRRGTKTMTGTFQYFLVYKGAVQN